MIVWKCSRFNCWCDAIVMCREYPQHFRFSFHIQWMVAIIYPHIQCFHTYTHILSQSAARPAYEHVKGQGQATNLHLNNQQRNNLLNKSCTRARLQWTHIHTQWALQLQGSNFDRIIPSRGQWVKVSDKVISVSEGRREARMVGKQRTGGEWCGAKYEIGQLTTINQTTTGVTQGHVKVTCASAATSNHLRV